MMAPYSSLFLLAIVGLSNAAPSRVQHTPNTAIHPRAVCTPTSSGDSSTDDVPAITEALTSCGNGGTIVFPEGSTYYLNSVLDLGKCSNCDIQVEGLLKFASDTDYWSGRTAMISVSDVDGLKLRSLTGSGVIDGNGQDAYDLFAQDSSYKRPTLLYITGGSNIEISGLRQKNPPNVFNSVKGAATNIAFSNLRMDATSKSDNPAKNTDGFDIGESTYVTITEVTVVNDDDCVAFKPSSNYVTVDTISCTGSHGISVGSLGKSNADSVKNIYVTGATMINSTKAAGIKTYPSGDSHGVSTVSNVTFTDFTVENSDYAFQIQSCYGEDDDYCEEHPGNAQLTDVTVSGFSGTTSDKYDPVVANIDCGADGKCGITISGFEVKAPSGDAEVLCANTPSDLGVTCTSGASG